MIDLICQHVEFETSTGIVKIVDDEKGERAWKLTIRVRCKECLQPFDFGPVVLTDKRRELSVAIRPTKVDVVILSPHGGRDASCEDPR